MLESNAMKTVRNNCIFFVILAVCFTLPATWAGAQRYGLVLAGGGGKGAYQVGVWKALYDYGIAQKTVAISGTSAGGLNAALFVCVPPQTAEEIWLDYVPDELTQDALISQTGLQNIIDMVPLQRLKTNMPHVCVTAVRNRFKLVKTLFPSSVGDHAHRFWLNEETDTEEIGRKLLATSAFPVLTSPVKLSDGYEYTDGGEESAGGDNVPITPIVDSYPSIQDIIVVYTSDAEHLKRRIKVKNYDWIHITEIIPSIDLDGNLFSDGLLEGTTNFTRDRIQLLIRTGYADTVAILKSQGFYPVADYWFR